MTRSRYPEVVIGDFHDDEWDNHPGDEGEVYPRAFDGHSLLRFLSLVQKA